MIQELEPTYDPLRGRILETLHVLDPKLTTETGATPLSDSLSTIDKEKAVSLAKNELIRKGWDVERMKVGECIVEDGHWLIVFEHSPRTFDAKGARIAVSARGEIEHYPGTD